ncbi:hypothetical protein MOX02_60160 [Methylobacterium oxalidis]|uniref:Uncharacterized protein n=1 Tax=Methylobacterium oxalidis TaxID=944322 RepID=A0A512JDI2_9HYPH|nr:hypothetical protein MOX02_60160 [Methylobacterium oxalidis]GLS64515.1 hypothetical protein GCM10007888_28960 [Methylobacterium oxalidis]
MGMLLHPSTPHPPTRLKRRGTRSNSPDPESFHKIGQTQSFRAYQPGDEWTF